MPCAGHCSPRLPSNGGTIDLFPEEGKYHADGHRACNVCLPPEESLRLGGLCPVCGKPLVRGVLHRVVELADRAPSARSASAANHEYIVPLPELLAEILGCGSTTRKATAAYAGLLTRFGSEMSILRELPCEALEHAEPALLGEAIRRVRAGHGSRVPGYDDKYKVSGPGSPRSTAAGSGASRYTAAGWQSRHRPPPPSRACGRCRS